MPWSWHCCGRSHRRGSNHLSIPLIDGQVTLIADKALALAAVRPCPTAITLYIMENHAFSCLCTVRLLCVISEQQDYI
jgi:hypothetical protein